MEAPISRVLFAVATIFALTSLSASAVAGDQTRRVAFRNGRAVVTGVIKGYDTHDYVFPAGAGESIAATLKSRRAFFNLNPPGGGDALFNGSSAGETFRGAAPTSGDYTARVYLMRNEARRGTASPYTLTVTLGAIGATQEKGPDFADGLTGGPDGWEVTGVTAGDTLNLRATPSPKGGLVAKVANGAKLKNLGCKNTLGQRWCRVATDAEAKGWVNGRYLRESSQ
jgi:hypothetical protein